MTACPGSGKTETCVRRFLARAAVGSVQGIAYLSFTNVAVDEVRRRARKVSLGALTGKPNVVATLDGFFRTYVFEPFIEEHIGSDMPAVQIIDAKEPPPQGLSSEKAFDVSNLDDRPVKAWTLKFNIDESGETFFDFPVTRDEREVADAAEFDAIFEAKKRLLIAGFATYNDILFWCHQILADSGNRSASILALRFRELIIDEAQDTSRLQRSLLGQMETLGTKVSYAGDPNQAIFGFAGNDPRFLQKLVSSGLPHCPLSENFRSNDKIVEVVNARFKSSMRTSRVAASVHGAFVFVGSATDAIHSFEAALEGAGIAPANAAVLVRKRSNLKSMLSEPNTKGLMSIPRYAVSAWRKERSGDFESAAAFAGKLMRESVDGSDQSLDDSGWKKLGWSFLRSEAFPIPETNETPKQWGRRLSAALQTFISDRGLKKGANFSRRAATTNLLDKGTATKRFGSTRPLLRTTTIHSVKGETIRGVLIVAPIEEHEQWLTDHEDPSDEQIEELNVCYVAMTRAADLLVLQCPDEDTADRWRGFGFRNLDSSASTSTKDLEDEEARAEYMEMLADDDPYDFANLSEFDEADLRERDEHMTRILTAHAKGRAAVRSLALRRQRSLRDDDYDKMAESTNRSYSDFIDAVLDANSWLDALGARISAAVDEVSHLTPHAHDSNAVLELQAWMDNIGRIDVPDEVDLELVALATN